MNPIHYICFLFATGSALRLSSSDSTAGESWIKADMQNQTCDDVCRNAGQTCDFSGYSGGQPTGYTPIHPTMTFSCWDAYKSFPVESTGQTFNKFVYCNPDYRGGMTPDCNLTGVGAGFRVCKCADAPPASVVGDPHVTNLAGEKFDIQQPGNHHLLVLRDAVPKLQRVSAYIDHVSQEEDNLLGVSAYIDRVSQDDECSPLFIQNVTLAGKWMKQKKWEELAVRVLHFVAPHEALQIKSGAWHRASEFSDSSGIISKASSRELLVKVNDLNLAFSLGLNRGRRAAYPGYNFLNLKIQGVAYILRTGLIETKGLLAYDDFADVKRRQEKCEHSAGFARSLSEVTQDRSYLQAS